MAVQLYHRPKKEDNKDKFNNKLSWKIDKLTRLMERLLNKLS